MEIAKSTVTDAGVLHELKSWMETAGLTHEDVAEIAGCSRSQITRTLQGKQSMPADRAAKLAAVSGIPLERLVSDPETARILKLLGKRSTPTGRRPRKSTNVA